MAELHVTSASNPRLRAVLALRRRRVREEEGRTVVDGYEELALALDAGVVPDTVLHCPELMLDPARQSALVERARALGASTIRCSRAAFEKVAYREGPDGFLAVVPVAGAALDDLVAARPTRSCWSARGSRSPATSARCCARRMPRASPPSSPPTRSPTGATPTSCAPARAPCSPCRWRPRAPTEVLAWLRRNGIRLVATTPDTDTAHTDVDYRGAVAIAVGTEKEGLTDVALEAADDRVRIPMVGRVELAQRRDGRRDRRLRGGPPALRVRLL